MKVVILTGGIGAGKSTAAGFLRSKGATVIDADEVAASLLSAGAPLLALVVGEFGPEVLLADGGLDRGALARASFATRERAATLDAIVHPAVTVSLRAMLSGLRASSAPPTVVVVEVPLLAEAPDIAALADVVVAVVAPQELRVQRAVAGGMPEVDARRRLAVQASDAERAALADVVLVNDASKEHYLAAVGRLWGTWIAQEHRK